MFVVPVRIMVDDDERAARPAWEKRLRGRIEEASKILARDCGVKLQVVDSGTWVSDNQIHDFPKSLDEFERKVPPSDRLTIGFTSQYTLIRGQTHLGGIHGPLARHLLVREWSQVMTEPERLEVLLHELGHFFGAAHSPEPDSVMRPSLADRKARAANFRIGLDPLNTIVATLIGEQLRSGERNRIGDLTLDVQLRLRPIYAELARAMPDDGNPQRYLKLIDEGRVEQTAQATAALMTGLTTLAARLPGDPGQPASAAEALQSPEWRLRTAASLARQLPGELQISACLLAVGLSGPQRGRLTSSVLLRPVCQRIDEILKTPDAAQAAATATSAAASPRGRLERLLASAALAACLGGPWADGAALAECGIAPLKAEAIDLAAYADACAGCLLAVRLADPAQRITLAELAQRTDAAGYLPSDDLRQKLALNILSPAAFERQFGSATDPRFLELRSRIYASIAAMAAYR